MTNVVGIRATIKIVNFVNAVYNTTIYLMLEGLWQN